MYPFNLRGNNFYSDDLKKMLLYLVYDYIIFTNFWHIIHDVCNENTYFEILRFSYDILQLPSEVFCKIIVDRYYY